MHKVTVFLAWAVALCTANTTWAQRSAIPCTWFLTDTHSSIVTQPSAEPTTALHAHNPLISRDDWERLRTARIAAFKANPSLTKNAHDLTLKLQAFREKEFAEMIKADPKMARIITLIENREKPENVPRLSPSK